MMWETLPAWGRCPPLRRSSRGSNSPGSLSASSRAMSHTRTEPRLLPVHSSPQGVRHIAVTDPTLCACQTPTPLTLIAQSFGLRIAIFNLISWPGKCTKGDQFLTGALHTWHATIWGCILH